MSNSPIVVEPVEVTSLNSPSTKRRGVQKRKVSAIKSEGVETEVKKGKQKIETSTDDPTNSKSRKRNVKQKYSSQEWITEELPTRRKSDGTENGSRQSSSEVAVLPEVVDDFLEHDESTPDADEDFENDITEEDEANIKTEYSIRGKKHSASLAQWREGVKCPHCIYVGHSATRLEQHLARVHEEDNTYKCRLCTFTCKWNREYYKHMKTHFDGPPYKCEDCEYTCDRIQFILSHRMRHTDERPFHCELCTFKSRTKGNLIVHMRIHTGEKPYKCQFCGRCFAMKNTLDQHLATHRDDRPFLCDICGFTTKYQSHLLSHKRIHTGNVFHCQQAGCSYFSPRRSQLAAHMRSHLSIRSHICSTCGRGFIEKSHLIRHERIHLEEKPFKCEYCDYGSTRRDKLKEHVLKHHSGDGNSKTPYKPRKPRRQSAVNISVGDDVH
ncbi:Zinc finger protein 782-like protein, partial [Leptotrombidium deliense]